MINTMKYFYAFISKINHNSQLMLFYYPIKATQTNTTNFRNDIRIQFICVAVDYFGLNKITQPSNEVAIFRSDGHENRARGI